MSQINTNTMVTNYPIPGQNNSTQGFRDNFSSIKNNLNTAGAEITDLQQKVILKAALTESGLNSPNNNMQGAPLSNARISSLSHPFAAVQGTSVLNNIITVNTGAYDVQTIDLGSSTPLNLTGNVVTLNFTGWSNWAPQGTAGTVELVISNFGNGTIQAISLANSNITSGLNTLEGFDSANNYILPVIDYSTGLPVSQLVYQFSTIDCGDNITVTPINRPRATTSSVSLPTAPLNPQAGDIYYDTTLNLLRVFDGTTWASTSGVTPAGGANTQVQFNSNGAFAGSNNLVYNSVSNTLITKSLSVTTSTNLGGIGNVVITGGTPGQYITTNGSGNLSFATITSGITAKVFASSEQWTVPAGVNSIKITAIGGGGGGGGGNASSGGSGGGAGGTGIVWQTVSPGDLIDVTISAGGTAGAPGIAGTTGGTTLVVNTTTGSTIATCAGGGGGAPSTVASPGAGGVASAVGTRQVVLAGAPGIKTIGYGGSSQLGAGGMDTDNGTGYGAGGGGGAANGSGGAGSPGIVIIEY